MNKQGINGIEWCDYTWNPVTGCLNGCEYCYARKMFHRFGKSFEPTMHPEKLEEPAKLKKPSRIFVGSTTDLFGDWVPDEWVRQVFNACNGAPWHEYLFLTKNPKRYYRYEAYINKNFWLGATIGQSENLTCCDADTMSVVSGNKFVSIEPIMFDVTDWVHLGEYDWVIVGAETGNRAEKVVPPRQWIEAIARACIQYDVPLFMKRSLAGVWGDPLIQELPTALRIAEVSRHD